MFSLKSKLAGLLTACVISLGLTGAAHAQVVRTPITHNGATCYRHDGGVYPENGHYFWCGTTANDPNEDEVLNSIRAGLNTAPDINTKMINNDVTFYIWSDPVQRATFNASQPPTQAALQAYYNSQVNIEGDTFNFICNVYQKIAYTGGYPNFHLEGTGAIQHTALHEMGHAYDEATGFATSNPAFSRTVAVDQVYMTTNAKNPTAAQLRSTYSYYLAPQTKYYPSVWSELYAEEFAEYIITKNPGVATADPVQAAALVPYFKASNLYVEKNIEDGRQPTVAELVTVNAGNALPGCVLINTNSGWPNQNAYYCGTNSSGDQGNINAFFTTLNGDGQGFLGTQNASQNPIFYLFATQAAANKALAALGVTMTANTPSQTFYTAGVSVVVETLGSTSVQVKNRTQHEQGLWLNLYSYGNSTGSTLLTSDTAGWTTELNFDIAAFNALGGCAKDANGIAVFSGQKDYQGNLICNGTSLSSTYAGLKNWNVVLKAWPVLSDAQDGGPTGGVFAELMAVETGAQIVVNQMYAYQDAYLGNISGEFSCTKAVISGLIESNNPTQHLPPTPVCPAYK